jgi:hypothetical protein
MVLVRVIGSFSRGWWRVIVGPGVGMLDGGSHQDWPEEDVPMRARFPNGEFWVSGFRDGRPRTVDPDRGGS